LGAYAIDWVLLYIVLTVLSYIMGGGSTVQSNSTAYPFLVILVILLPAFYFIWFWSDSGRTLGQKVLGLKVVRPDGSLLTVQGAVVRYIGYVVSAIPIGLGFLWMLWDPQGQTWTDKIAGTEVIVTGSSR